MKKKSRLDKLYKVTIQSGGRQQIHFFKYKRTVDKYVAGAKKLRKKYNVEIKILVRKPLK